VTQHNRDNVVAKDMDYLKRTGTEGLPASEHVLKLPHYSSLMG